MNGVSRMGTPGSGSLDNEVHTKWFAPPSNMYSPGDLGALLKTSDTCILCAGNVLKIAASWAIDIKSRMDSWGAEAKEERG